MKIEIATRGIPHQMQTVQLLRMGCPKCHQAVEFIIDEEDKQYKPDMEHYKIMYERAIEQIENMQRTINMLSRKNI